METLARKLLQGNWRTVNGETIQTHQPPPRPPNMRARFGPGLPILERLTESCANAGPWRIYRETQTNCWRASLKPPNDYLLMQKIPSGSALSQIFEQVRSPRLAASQERSGRLWFRPRKSINKVYRFGCCNLICEARTIGLTRTTFLLLILAAQNLNSIS